MSRFGGADPSSLKTHSRIAGRSSKYRSHEDRARSESHATLDDRVARAHWSRCIVANTTILRHRLNPRQAIHILGGSTRNGVGGVAARVRRWNWRGWQVSQPETVFSEFSVTCEPNSRSVKNCPAIGVSGLHRMIVRFCYCTVAFALVFMLCSRILTLLTYKRRKRGPQSARGLSQLVPSPARICPAGTRRSPRARRKLAMLRGVALGQASIPRMSICHRLPAWS